MYGSLSSSVRQMRRTGSQDAGLGGEIDENGNLKGRDDKSPPAT